MSKPNPESLIPTSLLLSESNRSYADALSKDRAESRGYGKPNRSEAVNYMLDSYRNALANASPKPGRTLGAGKGRK